MTEREEDDLELREARKALIELETAEVHTADALRELRQASAGVRNIVEKNGYLERFRTLFQGAR